MDHNRICDNCGGLINDAAVYHGRFLSHLDASVCFEKLRADLASMEAERDAETDRLTDICDRVWYALRPPLGTTPAQIGGAVPVVTLAERVAQERDAAVAVLRLVEWKGHNCDRCGYAMACPRCGRCPPKSDWMCANAGHADNCALAAAIGGAK